MIPARRALLFDSALAFALSALGCASSQETKRLAPRPLVFEAGDVSVYLRQHQRDLLFEQALPAALTRLFQSGLRLKKNSEIWVHKDIAAFTLHSKQSDPALRAYARYAIVHVLPRRYWGEKSKEVVVKRLVHELSHLALFQSLGSESDARTIGPPFWFSEGLASVVAEQTAQRMPLALVVKSLVGKDALEIVQSQKTPTTLRYGIAHHLMAGLRKDPSTPSWTQWIEHASRNPRRGNVESSYERLSSKPLNDIWNLSLKLNAVER